MILIPSAEFIHGLWLITIAFFAIHTVHTHNLLHYEYEHPQKLATLFLGLAIMFLFVSLAVSIFEMIALSSYQ